MSVEHEKKIWDNYFAEAIEGKGQESEIDTSLWWKIPDRDVTKLVTNLFSGKEAISVLEAGCGSGVTSFYLSRYITLNNLVLLDISLNALNYAKLLEDKSLNGKVEYIEGNIFNLVSLNRSFDLVWNIGLIEHYQPDEIIKIVHQMYNVTSPQGYMIIGIPNRNSIAVKKAAILGSNFGKKFLTKIRGYRNTSEILYSNAFIKNLIQKELQENVEIHYGGSPLWVGAPTFLVKFFDNFLHFKKAAFLTFFVVKKKNNDSFYAN